MGVVEGIVLARWYVNPQALGNQLSNGLESNATAEAFKQVIQSKPFLILAAVVKKASLRGFHELMQKRARSVKSSPDRCQIKSK